MHHMAVEVRGQDTGVGGGWLLLAPCAPAGLGHACQGYGVAVGWLWGPTPRTKGKLGGLGGLHWNRWGWDPACRSSAPLTTAVPSPPCRAPLQRGTPGQGAQRVRAGVPSL